MSAAAEKVRAELHRLLRARLDRVLRCLADGAPDALISGDCQLIGELAPLLDPEGWARHQASRHAAYARQLAGVCTMPECEGDAAPGDRVCAEHGAEADAEFSAALAARDDSDSEEPSS